MADMETWLREHQITEVESLVADRDRYQDWREYFGETEWRRQPAVHESYRGTAEIPASGNAVACVKRHSYRRLRRYSDAPIGVHWGWENRTVGLRAQKSGRASRPIEGSADHQLISSWERKQLLLNV